MIELNLTNFITVGIFSLIFFGLVEWGKKKFTAQGKAANVPGSVGA